MLTHRELLTVLDELETLSCQLPAQWHRALARLQAETTPKELGAKNWKDVLRIRWRITATDANRRLAEAEVLGPRRTLTGEPLAPVLAATAAAQARRADQQRACRQDPRRHGPHSPASSTPPPASRSKPTSCASPSVSDPPN